MDVLAEYLKKIKEQCSASLPGFESPAPPAPEQKKKKKKSLKRRS